jgi:hypothetical protein
MKRVMTMAVLAAAIVATGATESEAAGLFNRGGSGGILARLNKPLVPAQPGLPTVSPLGLISPRMSNAVLIFQKGGFTTPAGRLAALGVVSPRISPAVALVRTPPATQTAKLNYGLSILSPRVATLLGLFKAARTLPGSVGVR